MEDVRREVWSASHVVVWSMATATDGMKKERMPISTQDSIMVRFIKKVIDASIELYEHRAQRREALLKDVCDAMKSLKQMMMDTLLGREEVDGEEDVEDMQEDEISTDDAGWSTEDTVSEGQQHGEDVEAGDTKYAYESEGTESSAPSEGEDWEM